MQLKLTYDEIGKLIKEKAGKELPLMYSGPHTVRVGYKVPMMGSVGVDISVDGIEGGDLFLSYSGGIDFVVNSLFFLFFGFYFSLYGNNLLVYGFDVYFV